jgi:D-alanyl-D-alanine carboxypeptidase/D-alanyl-D-alanine-endopeptidase (penicillin-binding protein 4)
VQQEGGTLGAVVFDLNTSREWVAIGAEQALNPASNQKLVTAAAALAELGPSYRYRTSLYGTLAGDAVRDLSLTGHGDPSLASEDLWRLARALRAQGVARVEGDVVVDQSRFDDKFVPPAFEQQPDEWASFRAPVSAISVDQNTVTLNVLAEKAGEAARTWFEPPGFVEATGSVKTLEAGHGQDIAWRLEPAAGALKATLSGHVSAGQSRVRLVRRVVDPRELPGKVLVALLKELGVQVKGKVRLGHAGGGTRLAYLTSAPLAELLAQLGKESDNFYAETIFKSMGARESGGAASAATAAARVEAWLARVGLGSAGTKIVNGSGLFDANRVSAETLARLLTKVYLDPALAPDFVAQLAVGGVDGTLRSRFRAPKTRGRIRAKTGTLRRADALSGYVLSSSGRLPLVFVTLVNGIESRHEAVHARVDRAIGVLADAD